MKKGFLIFAGIIFFSNIILSQTEEQADSLLIVGDYREALKKYQSLLTDITIAEKEGLNDIYIKIGRSFAGFQFFDSAKAYYNKCEKYYTEKKTITNPENYYLSYLYKALIDYELGDYPNALDNFQTILKISKKKEVGPPSNLTLIETYNGLAKIYLNFDYFDKAKDILIKAKEIAEKDNLTSRLSYIETIALLSCHIYKTKYGGRNNDFSMQADTYFENIMNDTSKTDIEALEKYWSYLKLMGTWKKMKPVIERLMGYYKLKYGEEHPLYAKSLLNLAYYHTRYIISDSIALEAFKKVKLIRENCLSENHPLYADACHYLGIEYFINDRKQEAFELQNEALRIRGNYFGKDHPLYADILKRLSIHAKINKQRDLQESYLLNSLTIYENIYGQFHPGYIDICYELIRFYKEVDRLKDAERLYDRITDLRMKLYGKDSRRYFDALENQANFYKRNKNYKKATKIYEKVLVEAEKHFGKTDTKYTQTLETLIKIYPKTEDNLKVKDSYDELLLIRKEKFGDHNFVYINTLQAYSKYLESIKEYENALIGYKKVSDLTIELKGKDSYNSVFVLNDLANIYYKTKDYEHALDLYTEAAKIYKSISSKIDKRHLNLIKSIARCYERLLDFSNAETFYCKVKDLSEEAFGDSSYRYSVHTKDLGQFYFNLGKYGKAEKMYLEAKDIREKEKGKQHSSYILMCRRLGLLYHNSGDFPKAEKYFEEAKHLRFIKYGNEHEKYIEISMKIIPVYIQKNRYQTALNLLDTCDMFYEKDEDKYFKDHVNCLNYYGKIYESIGSYKKAENYYKRSKEISFKRMGKENAFYTRSLNNLAMLYETMGHFEESEQLFKEAVSIGEKVFGDTSSRVSSYYNNLALLYKIQDKGMEAENLLLKSNAIFKKIYGEDHPKYAISIGNLASLFRSFGNDEKAEELYKESIRIIEKTYGKEDSYYMTSINNLGHLYVDLKKYDAAKSCYEEALTICEKIFGKDHLNYASYLASLGNLYSTLKKYDKAEEYLILSKKIYGNVLGKDHISYASVCTNLGVLYRKTDKYLKSLTNYSIAKKIYEINFGKQHSGYFSTLNKMAELHRDMGSNSAAENNYLEANALLNSYIDKADHFMTEKERELFLSSNVKYLSDRYHSFYLIERKNNPELAGVVYNNSIKIKGHLLRSSVSIRKAILKSNDSLLINLYKTFNEYGKLLSDQYALPVKERRSDIETIENESNTIEKQLIKQVSKNKDIKRIAFKDVTWQDIQNSLKEDEAAVEFIQFKYHKKDVHTRHVLYYALVLRKDFDYPKAVYLTYESLLADIMNIENVENDYQYIKQLYDLNSKTADSLYKLSFYNFEKYLKGCKTIYLSPTGLFNKLAFDAIPCDSASILSDKFNIKYTTGTSNIVNEYGYYSKDIKNTILFGGLKYDMTAQEMKDISGKLRGNKEGQNEYRSKAYNFDIDSLSRGISWSYLPGTKIETEEIKNIFEKKSIDVKLFSGVNGNEEQFKMLDNKSPSVIHISTHGYYFPENNDTSLINKFEDINFISSDNPLLRSGLLLSGGNTTFKGGTIPVGIEDGVLSAQEIANMNLFNTKLSVLSACQTGLGDVKGSEGVYGLQRAFKMAGVDYLIISLWEVPDIQTKELMVNFYESWLSGNEIRTAFKNAQDFLKQKYKNVEGAAYAWAAFVLIR